ncbi:MAG: hypothetical protein ACYDAC_03080 [Candidatus Dormibacteria bacterium]
MNEEAGPAGTSPAAVLSLEEVERRRAVTPAQGAAIFDALLAALEALDTEGRRASTVDAGTVLITDGGTVELAVPAGSSGDAAGTASPTAAAAGLVRPLLARGGRSLERVAHLVDAVLEGRAATSASGVRQQLAVAATPLGPAWNAPAVLQQLLTPGAPVQAGRRHRRWLWVMGAFALLLAGGGVAVWLLLTGRLSAAPRASAPLAIGKDVAVAVKPAQGGCNTTFDFRATGSVSGAGELVYRWEQSDGQTSDNQTLRVTALDGSFLITQSWRLQGAQSVNGKETFHILEPTDLAVTTTFQYHCP